MIKSPKSAASSTVDLFEGLRLRRALHIVQQAAPCYLVDHELSIAGGPLRASFYIDLSHKHTQKLLQFP